MGKRLLVLGVLLGLFLLPTILANSVDSEIQKITHYAEDYETGNIDYIRLMLYLSSARGGLNEVLGATGKEMGGIVKQITQNLCKYLHNKLDRLRPFQLFTSTLNA